MESLYKKIADLEQALENPLVEPRLNLLEYKGGYSVSAGRRIWSLGHSLQHIYDAIDRCTLQNIDNQTPEICLEAVKQNEYELLFIKEQTPEICLEAVKQNPSIIRYINPENQTEEIALEVVKKAGNLLQYITPKNQTDEVCFTAIENSCGWAVRYIENQKLEYCLAALKINDLTFCAIKKEFHKNEIISYAIQKRPSNIMYIENPSEELLLEAVRLEGEAFYSINAPKNQAVCLAAVEQNPKVLLKMKEKYKTFEVCLAAVKKDGFVLHCIKNQTAEMCRMAVEQNPKFAKYVKDKSMIEGLCIENLPKKKHIHKSHEEFYKEFMDSYKRTTADDYLDRKNNERNI